MKFCINVIAYNEEKNIGKMAESAEAYMKAGGKIYLFDTGSTDNTIEVAEKLGFNVMKSKVSFNRTLNKPQLNKWKQTFKVTCTPLETPIVYFCFDLAREAASEVPVEDMMFFADGCDHFVNFNYEAINKLIDEGYRNFVTMQKYGGSKGGISRFYDRRIGKWEGHVHEHIVIDAKTCTIPEEDFCIEHKVIEKDRGNKYMAGLIATHLKYQSQRWHYYVARELWIRKEYADARRMFERRYNCPEFPEERAAAMCWAAKCKKLEKGTDDEVYSYYKKAYDLDTNLREACFEYCQYHFVKENWKEVLEGAEKCTKIIKEAELSFFEDNRFNEDHNLSWYLFNGYWNTGSIDLAIYHWRKFIESRNLIEEKHKYWKTYNLSKYKYFPKIPFEIKNLEYGNESYKCMGDIESTPSTSDLDSVLVTFARKFTPPLTSVVDTHAGKGYFTISLSKMQYPHTVHAFECIDYKELVTNTFLNSRDNIKTHELFLSNSTGVQDLSVLYKKKTDVDRRVDRKKLDDFQFETLSLIKVNETELSKSSEILEGAKDLIDKFKPTIIVVHNSKIPKVSLPSNYTLFGTRNMNVYVPPTIKDKKRVAILCFSDGVKWNDSNFKGKYTQLGDSEYAVVNLSLALVLRGMAVDVWCDTPKNYNYNENPRYLDYRYFDGYFDSSEYYNAVIYWRYGYEIRTKHKSTKNILWMQEHNYPKPEEGGNLHMIDSIVVLSENHKIALNNSYKDDPQTAEMFKDKINIIPNSLHMSCNVPQRVKNRCCYLNNRACGLEVLLTDWEMIKDAIPDAELYILHGPQTWGLNSTEKEKAMSETIKSLKSKGVHAQHTLTQQHLQCFLETCDFWLYPSIYEEIYNISGIQAANAGVIPIVSDQAFLRRLTVNKCVTWPLDNHNFGRKCIEIMSLGDKEIKDIREGSTTLGKIAFCDLERQGSLFDSII